MSTWLNRGRLRRLGRGLEDREEISRTESTNRLTHRNPDTPQQGSSEFKKAGPLRAASP